MSIKQLRYKLERLRGEKQSLKKKLKKDRSRLKELQKEVEASTQAQALIQKVAKGTQNQLSVQLSSIVSVAMKAVFENPYEIELEFVERRGRVELDIFFVRNGTRIEPKHASGGGAIDLASMALRLSCWAISRPQTRNVIIMDEPLKWLKGDGMPEKGAKILQEISKKLNLQIIMVSHSPELIDSADMVFKGRMKEGIVNFKEVENVQ